MAKITKRTLDAFALPAKGEAWLWDSELAGFGVRAWASGRMVYVFQYRHRGRTRRLTLGKVGELTPSQARDLALKALAATAQGADPASQRRADREAATVRELADRYLTEYAATRKKQSSIYKDNQWINRFILPALGSLRVQDMTREEVAKLHYSMRETPYQANRMLEILRKMFNLAEKWGMRPDGSNPCRHVERFKEHRRQRFLTPDELARLGQALSEVEAEGSEHPGFVLLVRLLLLTGCRLGEIRTLRWEDVDFGRGCLCLEDSKTGPREVALSAPALGLLSGAERFGEYVVPGLDNAPLVGVYKPWYRLLKRAGLEGLRLHDLRHSFASVGAAAGLGLPLIGALLGHVRAETTNQYAHLYQDPLRVAADEIAGRIQAALAKAPAQKVIPLPKRGR